MEDAGGNVLKLHAGDAITGTSFYTLFKGEADAELMSHACFDAVAVGNHEFDDGDKGAPRPPAGPEPRTPYPRHKARSPSYTTLTPTHACTGLADFIGHLHAMPKQQCPAPTVLGANVEPGPDSPLMALPEEQQIKPYTIKTFPNGEKVGIVGIGNKAATMNGGVDKGTVLVDEKVAAQAAVDELTCKGINKIVMLTHIGCGPLGAAHTTVHAPSPYT